MCIYICTSTHIAYVIFIPIGGVLLLSPAVPASLSAKKISRLVFYSFRFPPHESSILPSHALSLHKRMPYIFC